MSDTVTTEGIQDLLPGWTAGTWTIDTAHSQVNFAARHLMSKVRGTFEQFTGQIVTGDDPAASSVTAEIEMSSVNTGLEMRDTHLKSGEFFDVEKAPKMTFVSSGLRREGDGWVLAGELTIRDITRPVALTVEFLGVDPTGMQGETRIGFEAHTTISRKDFGVSFGLATDGSKIIIGDKVEVSLDIEAFLG